MKIEEKVIPELRGLPRAIAVELEDHFHEEVALRRATGISEAQARQEALQSLGDVSELAREMEGIRRHVLWRYARPPWEIQVLVSGWIAFSLLCLSRICTHQNPTYLSVATCTVFGLAGSAIGLSLLHRHERIRRVALGSSLMIGSALLAKLALAAQLPVVLPFPPLSLAALAAGALISAWMLSRRTVRNCCV